MGFAVKNSHFYEILVRYMQCGWKEGNLAFAKSGLAAFKEVLQCSRYLPWQGKASYLTASSRENATLRTLQYCLRDPLHWSSLVRTTMSQEAQMRPYSQHALSPLCRWHGLPQSLEMRLRAGTQQASKVSISQACIPRQSLAGLLALVWSWLCARDRGFQGQNRTVARSPSPLLLQKLRGSGDSAPGSYERIHVQATRRNVCLNRRGCSLLVQSFPVLMLPGPFILLTSILHLTWRRCRLFTPLACTLQPSLVDEH